MASDSDDQEATGPGTAGPAPVIKAGCGIRFDPEELSEDTGFDFSGAEKLKSRLKELRGDDEDDPEGSKP